MNPAVSVLGRERVEAVLARCAPAPHWTTLYDGAGLTVLRHTWAIGKYKPWRDELEARGALGALEVAVMVRLRRRLRDGLQAPDPLTTTTLEERTLPRAVELIRRAFKSCRYRTAQATPFVMVGVQLDGRGWCASAPTVVVSGFRLTLVVARAWLARVWARGLAVIEGRFVLDAWPCQPRSRPNTYHIIAVRQSNGGTLLPWRTIASRQPDGTWRYSPPGRKEF